MTSYVNTTAVSIRKGSTEANNGFTGVLGEVTADLGMPDDEGRVYGTDLHTTLRLHNGIDAGGIRMARADTRNITTEVLAENRETFGDKNLAYATLSNLEELNSSTQSGTINSIVDIFMNYGLANKDCRNVDTSDLATAGHGHSGENLAYANMSNVNTVNLASSTGHAGKNLAYADTSNINTANLVDTNIHTGDSSSGKPLAYADASNINTDNLAIDRGSAYGSPLLKADLTNAAENVFDNLFDDVYKVESTINKDTTIPNNTTDIQVNHYPETKAVKEYVDTKFNTLNSDYLNTNFSNVSTWELLYAEGNSERLYKYINTIETTGKFTLYDTLVSSIQLVDDKKPLGFYVSFDNNFYVEFEDDYTSIDISSYSPLIIESKNKQSTITIYVTSTEVNGGIYHNVINNFIISGNQIDFEENTIYLPINNTVIYNPFITLSVSKVDSDGNVTELQVEPNTGYTNLENQSITITDGVQTLTCIINAIDLTPTVGGAGLLKTNLTNLPGMSENDSINESNSRWRISHSERIPSITDNTPETEYYRIITSGLLIDAMRNILNIVWPVGSVYEGIQDICLLQNLIPGSQWELLEEEINLIENESGSNFYLNKWLRVK